MKISIVTVVFNAAATLEQTILSIHGQQYPEIEHIVIDGGSDDGSVEIIRKHQDKLAHWTSEPDDGLYDAMNKGIARATGEVVGTLNADDIYQDNQVLSKVANIFKEQGVESCYGDLVYVEQTDLDKVVRYWTSRDYRPGLFERGWMPAHPTFFVKNSIYQRFGGFRSELRFQADYELTARFLAVHGVSSYYFPEILVRMRTGGTTNRSWAEHN